MEETKTPQKIKRSIKEDAGAQGNQLEKQRNKSKTQHIRTCQIRLFSIKSDKGNDGAEDRRIYKPKIRNEVLKVK